MKEGLSERERDCVYMRTDSRRYVTAEKHAEITVGGISVNNLLKEARQTRY